MRPVATKQRGVALLTAIVIVALGTVLMTSMLWDTHLNLRRTENIIFSDQAWLYAMGGEDWAREILKRDRQNSKSDDLSEAWATPIAGLPIDGGSLSGQLEDLQGKFNLNDMVGDGGQPAQAYIDQFRRLRALLGINEPIENAIVDWMDPDLEPRFPGGAEDSTYLGQTPAYRAANQPMADVSELRMVAGVTPQMYQALLPYVTALPQRTAINVNTASVPVLMSLADGISQEQANNWVQQRQSQPFHSPQEFTSTLNGKSQLKTQVGVSSQWFALRTRVNIGSLGVSMYSLLARDAAGNVHVMKRTLGGVD